MPHSQPRTQHEHEHKRHHPHARAGDTNRGVIQPCCVLITLEGMGQSGIAQCGGDVEGLLGLPASEVLGRPLNVLMPQSRVEQILEALGQSAPGEKEDMGLLAVAGPHSSAMSVVVHHQAGIPILEFLPVGAGSDWAPDSVREAAHANPEEIPLRKNRENPDAETPNDACTRIRANAELWKNLGGVLRNHDAAPQLCGTLAECLRVLSGYERVIIQRFEPNGDELILAEARSESTEPMLGLRFPAGEIPPKAHDMFLHTQMRILEDAYAEPLPLQPSLHPSTGREADLSRSLTGGVSPLHRRYVGMMGGRATVVTPILTEVGLWGLILCLHSQPRFPNHAIRLAVGTLTGLLSAQIQICESHEHQRGRLHAHELCRQLSGRMKNTAHWCDEFIDPKIGMMEIVDADGLTLADASTKTPVSRGLTPEPEAIKQLVDWLNQRESSCIITDSLSSLAPQFRSWTTCASGIMAIRIPLATHHWLIWFRCEDRTPLRWVQRPPASPNPDAAEKPRDRSEIPFPWKTRMSVREGRSRPWTLTQQTLVAETLHPTLTDVLSIWHQSQTDQIRAHFAGFFAQLRDAVIITNLEGVVTSWNAGATHLFGWTPDEIIGCHLTTRYPEHLRPKIQSLFDKALNGEPIDDEWEDLHKNGEPVWVEARTRRILDDNNVPIAIMSISHDIRERKRQEQHIREANEQYQVVNSTINDIVSFMDANFALLYASPSSERILGYAAETLVKMDALFLVHPEDAEMMRSLLEGDIRRGKSVRMEWRCLHQAGHYVWLETAVNPAYSQQSQTLLGYVCCTRDIMERKQKEEHMRQVQKLEAVGQLAGGIAHDFNNLLTVVSGYTEMILNQLTADHPVRELVRQIAIVGQRGSELTHQLLAFSRKQILQSQNFDLNAVVEAISAMLARLIGENIPLDLDLDPEGCPLIADPGQFEHILINLVVNARDAMPDGGKLSIRTRRLRHQGGPAPGVDRLEPGDYIGLTVEDQGLGMDEIVRARIFEPFFTTKGVGKGTGLGLAVVYGIVQQSRGHIGVQSQVGVGTRFDLYFNSAVSFASPRPNPTPTLTPTVTVTETPLAITVNAAIPIAEPANPSAKRTAQKLTILLVEDDPAVRAVTTTMLRITGFEVCIAESVKAAIAICQNPDLRPDLIISDVVMPELGGGALYSWLQDNRPNLPVLFISGYTDDTILRYGIETASVRFLAKPYSPTELMNTVRAILDNPKSSS